MRRERKGTSEKRASACLAGMLGHDAGIMADESRTRFRDRIAAQTLHGAGWPRKVSR
jgi:hypothetical protein